MAYRIVDSTVPQNQHDTDRISAEVNTALHQYRTKWVAKKAVIISWEQFFGAGVSRFVVVIVVLLFYVHGKHPRSCRDGQLN